jgi:hypothetical protein
VSDRSNVVRCHGRKRHALAWLEVVEGEAIVVAKVVSPGRDHRALLELRMPADDLRGRMDEDQEPYEQFRAVASCLCGDRYDVDLVAVLRGRDQVLVQDHSDVRVFGVSFDR